MPATFAHFLAAQEPIYDQVLAELTSGRKECHWMWFVFPQLEGLGRSDMAARYALHDLEEARAYLAHPVLGQRLRHCLSLLLAHKTLSARAILGTPDDVKLRSCLTLFALAAVDPADRAHFANGLERFFDAMPDPLTLSLLNEA